LVALDVGAVAAKKTIHDECVAAVLQRCPKLLKLNVFGCWLVSGAAFVDVGKKCPELHYLNIGSTAVGDDGLRRFVDMCCVEIDHLLQHCSVYASAGSELVET
jgi:hypothetical protein